MGIQMKESFFEKESLSFTAGFQLFLSPLSGSISPDIGLEITFDRLSGELGSFRWRIGDKLGRR